MPDKEIQQGTDPGESLPPGTVRLIDTSGAVLSRHADGKGYSDIILIPRPSEDPEDPLNWSFRRKILATSCVVMYTIMIAIPSSAVYSIVTPIRADTSLTLTDINNGTGIMVCEPDSEFDASINTESKSKAREIGCMTDFGTN
jgi:hypothetical protein